MKTPTLFLNPLSLSGSKTKALPCKKCFNRTAILLLLICLSISFSAYGQLSGSYTIDNSKAASSTNYKSFRSAICDLDSGKRYDGGTANGKGVSGAVKFVVSNTTYFEQNIITPVSGASSTNTITFTSNDTGNTGKAILAWYFPSGPAPDDYVLKISGASFINISLINLYVATKGTSANFINILTLEHAVSNINVYRCRFTNSGTFLTRGIYSYNDQNTTDSNKVFLSNIFTSVYQGILMKTNGYTQSSSYDKKTIIKDNTIDSIASIFTDARFQDNLIFDNNSVLAPGSFVSGDHSLYLYQSKNLISISGNKLRGRDYCVFLDTVSGNASSYALISNNTLYGGTKGLFVLSGSNLNIYHNNIYSATTRYWNPRAVDISFYSKNVNFVNNIVQAKSLISGQRTVAIYIDSAYNLAKSDNNNYFSCRFNNVKDSLAQIGSTRIELLTGWQSITGKDKNSIVSNPNLGLASNLVTGNTGLISKGTPLSSVKYDIQGKSRSTTAPTIGAYELVTILKAGFKYSFIKGSCTDSTPTVSFTDTSYNSNPADSIIYWKWITSATMMNTSSTFNYKFSRRGLYGVLLVVTTKSGFIDSVTNVLSIGMLPTFGILADHICDSLKTVNFKDTVYKSYGASVNYSWDFGDGSTSTLAAPTHLYWKGLSSYIVNLTLSSYGCSSTVSTKLFPALIKLGIQSKNNGCGNVSLYDGSTTDINHTYDRLWDFGDNSTSIFKGVIHKYGTGGTYHYSCKVYTDGCSKTYNDSVKIAQYVNVGGYVYISNACSPDSVIFADSTYYKYGTGPYKQTIYFGDTTYITSFSKSYYHKYPGAGTYYMRHIVTDANGCTSTITQKIVVSNDLTALFKSKNSCHGTVTFTDYSTYSGAPIAGYLWDFGDGDTTGYHKKNPVHAYKKDSTYLVSLVVSNLKCTNRYMAKVTVNDLLRPAVSGATIGCFGDTLVFKGKELNNISNLSWFWSIPGETIDSSSNGMQTLKHKFSKHGYKKVIFSASNASGCSDTVSMSVFIDSACVWPGDADYNKKVNIKDVLNIGVAYSVTGPSRPNASISWMAQPAYDWSKTFKAGHNYKHADCNGDGVVDSLDLTAIVNNFGKTHPKTNQTALGNPNDPPLSISFSKDSAAAGDTIVATISLGSSTINAKNIYGITLSFSYGTATPKGIRADFSKSWLGTIHQDMFAIVHYDSSGKQIDIGVSRNDHKNVSGYGQIGTVCIMMPDNIAGKREVREMFNINMIDYKAISANETDVPLNPMGDSILVYQFKNSIQPQFYPDLGLTLYPNPAHDRIVAVVNTNSINRAVIRDIIGNEIQTINCRNENQVEIPVSNLSKGMYIIEITTDHGTARARFIKD
jgi:PKD repeat protein